MTKIFSQNHRYRLALAVVLFVGILSSCVSPPPPRPEVDVEPEKKVYKNGSLWPGAGKNNLLFSDNKASRVGDIVTVHIVEKTTAINKSNTQDDHSTESALTIDTGAATATKMKLGGGAKFKGNGVTGRSDQFSATVSCLVLEVMPNGNLVIEGQRRMKINNEEQYIVVRGIVRRDDITYNNTIRSSQMASADILYTGEGAMDGSKKPGWLSNAFRTIWPF